MNSSLTIDFPFSNNFNYSSSIRNYDSSNQQYCPSPRTLNLNHQVHSSSSIKNSGGGEDINTLLSSNQQVLFVTLRETLDRHGIVSNSVPNEVFDFIASNQLEQVVIQTFEKVEGFFSCKKKYQLRLYQDPEEDLETLFVVVRTNPIDYEVAADAADTLRRKWKVELDDKIFFKFSVMLKFDASI